MPVRRAQFSVKPQTQLRRALHSLLAIRGITDFIAVAIRDPDVLLLQLVLQRNGGLRGLYQFRRLRELGHHLRTTRQSVIEFGSGASTLLIVKHASAAISIEESDHWADRLRTALHNGWWIDRDLRQRALSQILVQRRKEWIDDNGEIVCGYELNSEVSTYPWDFAYVDGPTNWPQQDWPDIMEPPTALPNADVFTLSCLPVEIWVDGRQSTLEYLSRRLSEATYVLTEMDLPRASRRYFHTRFRSPGPTAVGR